MRTAKNYEDTKCHWGYATVCDDCVEAIMEYRIWRKHIHVTVEVHGFPLMDNCEICGERIKGEK